MQRRYAIAGTGVRGLSFAKAIQEDFPHCAELVGLFDHNATRAQGFASLLRRPVPVFADVAAMQRATRPDVLIITTPDFTHAALIESAFQHDMDAVVEKPMATTQAQVQRILALEIEYGRRVQVTFNMRYATYAARVKQVLRDEDIGTIKSVALDWYMDQVHGPEYFRRWHRRMANSGGLLVHKSSHHFDMLNWFLDDEPAAVTAMGSLEVFGSKGPYRGPRCRGCDHAADCLYSMDVATWGEASQDKMNRLYFNAEHEDGYIRDGCVFDAEIDIYDTMSVNMRYRRGTQAIYSLVAYGPYEGYRLSMTGTRGRLEASERFGAFLVHGWESNSSIQIIRGHKRESVDVKDVAVPVDRADHGGGDVRLFRHLFEPNVPDPLGQFADSRAGAAACLTGILANEAIRTGRTQEMPSLAPQAEVAL